MQKYFLRPVFLILALACILFALPVQAQGIESDTIYMQQQSDTLQDSAEGYKRQAEKLRSQAAQYRDLAKSADTYAAQASNIKDKADWEETARKHRAEAEKLEQQAAAEDDKGKGAGEGSAAMRDKIEDVKAREAAKQEKFDAQMAEVEARNAAQKIAEDNNPNKGKKVESFIGLWRDVGHEDEPFVIVQQDPGSKAYPNRLEAHTPRRVWKGDFHSDPPPGEPLITMTYKPKAEEMNPEIPEWARKKIEGTLEWKLKIDAAGTCGTPALSAAFYPGEVKWEEKEELMGKGKVSVEGEGEARRIDLRQSVADMRFYSYGSAKLFLRPPGLGRQKSDDEAAQTGDFNEYTDTVDALVQGQRFFIEAVLPYDEAKKQGETLTVNIKASGGDKTTVDLRAGAMRQGRAVRYTHTDPVTIADPLDVTEEDRDPPLLSMNYILGYQGARIDLDVENGELVTFSFGGAQQAVPVFNSWVQRGINQHQEAIQRLRPFFSLVLADPSATKEQKEQATKRLIMITNYERITDSDKIHDFIRYHVGDAYFNEARGLISMSPDEIQREAELTGAYYDLGDLRDGSKNKSGIYNGVVWTSQYEMKRIEDTVVRARVNYRDTALTELPRAMTFALYTTVMGMTGAGDAYTLSTGKDIFGKPVPAWQRVMSAISLVSSTTLTFTAPHVMTPPTMSGFNPSQLSGRIMRLGARQRLKLHEHINAKYGAQKLEAAMKTMNAEQVAAVAPGAGKPAEAGAPGNEPIGCGGNKKNPTAVTEAVPLPSGMPPLPAHPAPLHPRILELKARYGANVKVVNAGRTPRLPPQEFETCQLGSTQLAMFEDVGFAMSEMTQFGVVVRNGQVKVGVGEMPLAKGYNDGQTVGFLEATGAEVMTIPSRNNSRPLTLEAMDAWIQKGWRIRDVVRTLDTNQPHAIEPREMIRNEKGEITDVQWYDSAYGEILELPACDYINQLAAGGYDIILYRWKEGGKAQTVAARQPTIQYPKKPTIEYPDDTKRNPGAGQKRSDIDVSDMHLLDDKGNVVSRKQQAAHEAEVKRLDKRLEQLHPGNTKPHLNTISRESLRKIYASMKWLPPKEGGAAFSRAGSDFTGRHEVIAVRIRPGHENFVEMVPTSNGTGYVPRYWESGQKGVGKSSDIVPAEHFEWIDGDLKAWVPFTEKLIEVDEFTMDD